MQLTPEELFKASKATNTGLISETLQLLGKYPDAHELYLDGLNKIRNGVDSRNSLDDLRLSLEILLKQILGNHKTLENQLSDIGKYQKQKGLSTEISNMFNKLLDYYGKYQNNNVKHANNVTTKEIDFILDITSTFIKFLISQ